MADKTLFCYRECFNRFLKDTKCKTITKDEVIKWISILKSKKMTIPSINHYLMGLRTYLYWGMNCGYINQFKVPIQKTHESKLKMVLDEDLDTLLRKPAANCNFREYRSYVVISFIMATGARASTIVSIKREDVDFKNKEIVLTTLKNKTVAVNSPFSLTKY